jgi:hypothetical protein
LISLKIRKRDFPTSSKGMEEKKKNLLVFQMRNKRFNAMVFERKRDFSRESAESKE